jgi:hypothetical protein
MEALDAIEAVGPGGRHCMNQRHTLQNMSELHISEIARSAANTAQGTKRSIVERVHAKVE